MAAETTTDTRTDLELIEQCLTGDEYGFEELVNRYKNLVYSIIFRQTKNHEDADDIAQEVFIKVYRNLAKYTPEFKFSTWIMRITSNHIIDLHRKKKMETVSYETYTAEGGTIGTTDSPEAEYIRQEQTDRINKIIDGLPELYKTPVILYHQHGLSYQEISDTIGEPISKIKNRIFRGRKLLKSLLSTGE
ncbi:MAG: sigma-70 family RNA polymerase sigma factor [Defluviitaleaceae bacterium]|jgi:RNA polymerase sigma-70 factor (ECF subfamily)|nr:sigma-70 family RNA polymerase sigma factor [Defluviitaleaceae bacterium]